MGPDQSEGMWGYAAGVETLWLRGCGSEGRSRKREIQGHRPGGRAAQFTLGVPAEQGLSGGRALGLCLALRDMLQGLDLPLGPMENQGEQLTHQPCRLLTWERDMSGQVAEDPVLKGGWTPEGLQTPSRGVCKVTWVREQMGSVGAQAAE